MKDKRVELIVGLRVVELLHDDQAAHVAEPTASALTAEERNNRMAMTCDACAAEGTPPVRVGRAFAFVVAATSCCG